MSNERHSISLRLLAVTTMIVGLTACGSDTVVNPPPPTPPPAPSAAITGRGRVT